MGNFIKRYNKKNCDDDVAGVSEADFTLEHLEKIYTAFKKAGFSVNYAYKDLDFCLEPYTFNRAEMMSFVIGGCKKSIGRGKNKVTIESEHIHSLIKANDYPVIPTMLGTNALQALDIMNPIQTATILLKMIGKEKCNELAKLLKTKEMK